MSDGRDRVAVYLDAVDHQPIHRVGVLARERSRSTSVIAFAYDSAWLAMRDAFEIDPRLRLHEGDQHVAALPGVFGDAAPDRWGRMLMERREALIARRESRRPRRLDDWDFLVGVQDTSRMGALRLQRDGAFVADEPLSIPPSTELRTLEHWARQLEVGLPESQTDNDRWVAMLLAPGSSSGGRGPRPTSAVGTRASGSRSSPRGRTATTSEHGNLSSTAWPRRPESRCPTRGCSPCRRTTAPSVLGASTAWVGADVSTPRR